MCGMLNFSPTTLAPAYYKTIDKRITSIMEYSLTDKEIVLSLSVHLRGSLVSENRRARCTNGRRVAGRAVSKLFLGDGRDASQQGLQICPERVRDFAMVYLPNFCQ